jgi:hypothetical protein
MGHKFLSNNVPATGKMHVDKQNSLLYLGGIEWQMRGSESGSQWGKRA